MALPSGTIFITDDLIAALDDRHVMAVIAHEAGHVDKRHGLRKIIQSSVIGILVTWYVGDISAVAAAAPTALMQAKYSRDLRARGRRLRGGGAAPDSMPPSLLAEALEGLERSHAEQPGKASQSGALAYLSTHPATSERLEWLRAQH
jgi:Zn-dependent protease with chaperone function